MEVQGRLGALRDFGEGWYLERIFGADFWSGYFLDYWSGFLFWVELNKYINK